MKVLTMGKFLSVQSTCIPCEQIATSKSQSRIVSVWLAISLSFLCGFARGNANTTASEGSLNYKQYWYRTEQLCPDLQESLAGKDIDTANHPYKSVFRFVEHAGYTDLPCFLETSGPQRIISTALIEGIHIDTRPWNFSDAMTCEEHIKVRLPERTFLKRSNVPKILCKVPRPKFFKQSDVNEPTGDLFNPFIWEFPKSKLGISFSSFNLSHLNDSVLLYLREKNNGSSTSGDPTSQYYQNSRYRKDYWLEPDQDKNKYVQIVFITHTAGVCNVRIQQYLVDAERTLCEGVQQRNPFRLCGIYECDKMMEILHAMGFWYHMREVRTRQIEMLFRSDMRQWRKEPGYLEIFVKTIRALIMPLLFLGVFYGSRKLRIKMINRNQTSSRTLGIDRHRRVLRQRQCYLRNLRGSSQSTDGSTPDIIGSDSASLRPNVVMNHVMFDIPLEDAYEDPPPPYSSFAEPPTYLEATNTSKPTPSPVDNNEPAITIPDCEDSNNVENTIMPPDNASQNESTDEEMVALISSRPNANVQPAVQETSRQQQSSSSSLHLST